MKKLWTIAMLSFLFAFTSLAQRTYSKQNLEQVSHEDLKFLLKTAQKKKKTGAIMTVTGSALFITGFILESNADDHGGLNEVHPPDVIIGIGMWTVIVGVPILVVGSSRVKKVKKVQQLKPTTFNSPRLELAPCSFNCHHTRNRQWGITLRLSL